ncbi:MAG: hypothetical protein E7298_09050 [Lachnospiraceae bacterium]|nr:hypothetical protein [Lachnospiraceae bacterium]
MNYVIADIHNDKQRFDKMLKKISLGTDDRLYVLGDIFDRSVDNADPVGLYYTLLGIDQCFFVKGNHDIWLSHYIKEYYQTPPKKRSDLRPYQYNSFELMKNRIPQADMLKIADDIERWPLQITVSIGDEIYIFAHSMTSMPDVHKAEDYYLMGTDLDFRYLRNGIPGFISVCGHHPTSTIRQWYGDDYNPEQNEIWHNSKKNVYMIDCGCGFNSGRLACLRIEDKAEFYI